MVNEASPSMFVEKVKAAYPEVQALSNDELRAKTKEIQKYDVGNIKTVISITTK